MQEVVGRSLRMWGSKGSLFLETGDRAPQGLESRRNNCILRGQGKGQGSEEGDFSSRKPALLNIQREREVRMAPDTGVSSLGVWPGKYSISRTILAQAHSESTQFPWVS